MTTYNTKVTKLEKGQVGIEGEISTEVFESYREHAIEHLGEHVTIDGFRKGKVPREVLVGHLSEMAILEEMAEHALRDHYPKVLDETKIDAIGRPEISLTKIAKGNPLGFSIKTSVMPVVKLPDYLAIAKKEGKASEKIEVQDSEVEETIMQIRRSRSKAAAPAAGEAPAEVKDEDLPPLTDEFAQAIGDFKTVDDLRAKIRENMQLEKENREREKNRLTIMEKILEKTTMEVPDMLAEAELDKMLYRMKSDITMMGLAYEDYLKRLGKTEEDIRKEFRPDAEKRVKMELMIAEIAKQEKIVPDEEAVTKEIEHLMTDYKDADPDRVRMYVENILTNEMVFKLLEGKE